MEALDPSSTLDLRIRFHTLNHHLSDMDKAMQEQMTRLASSHDRDFYGSLLSGLAITGIAGTILFRIRRKYDEAVESKNLANKLLQAIVEGTDDAFTSRILTATCCSLMMLRRDYCETCTPQLSPRKAPRPRPMSKDRSMKVCWNGFAVMSESFSTSSDPSPMNSPYRRRQGCEHFSPMHFPIEAPWEHCSD